MRSPRLEPLDELDLLGEHRLLALELGLLLLLGQRALLLVELVVARVGGQRAPSISTTLVMMRFMNSRSCEVISSAPS